MVYDWVVTIIQQCCLMHLPPHQCHHSKNGMCYILQGREHLWNHWHWFISTWAAGLVWEVGLNMAVEAATKHAPFPDLINHLPLSYPLATPQQSCPAPLQLTLVCRLILNRHHAQTLEASPPELQQHVASHVAGDPFLIIIMCPPVDWLLRIVCLYTPICMYASSFPFLYIGNLCMMMFWEHESSWVRSGSSGMCYRQGR